MEVMMKAEAIYMYARWYYNIELEVGLLFAVHAAARSIAVTIAASFHYKPQTDLSVYYIARLGANAMVRQLLVVMPPDTAYAGH